MASLLIPSLSEFLL